MVDVAIGLRPQCDLIALAMPPCRDPREPLRGEVLICPGFSPKAYIRKISRYDKGDRTYPHRNEPAGDNHLPFEDEPQGVSDRDNEKNCASQQGKRIFVQLSLPPVRGWKQVLWRDCTPFPREGLGG